MPINADFTVWRGDTVPIAWAPTDAAGAPFNLMGSSFLLNIGLNRGGVILALNSAVDTNLTVDVVKGLITWTPTSTQSAMIPPGRICRYELIRIIGSDRRTWAVGEVTGTGGITYE